MFYLFMIGLELGLAAGNAYFAVTTGSLLNWTAVVFTLFVAFIMYRLYLNDTH